MAVLELAVGGVGEGEVEGGEGGGEGGEGRGGGGEGVGYSWLEHGEGRLMREEGGRLMYRLWL